MAREVVIYMFCDVCLDGEEPVRTEGQEVTVALAELNIAKPLTMALCERHRKELYDGLRDMLERHGAVDPGIAKPSRKGIGGRPKQADLACPKCDYVAPSKDGLGKHGRKMHDMTLTDLMGTAPGEHVCPECGGTFNRPQGLGAHRRSVHGVAGTSNPNGPVTPKGIAAKEARETAKATKRAAKNPGGRPAPRSVRRGHSAGEDGDVG